MYIFMIEGNLEFTLEKFQSSLMGHETLLNMSSKKFYETQKCTARKFLTLLLAVIFKNTECLELVIIVFNFSKV